MPIQNASTINGIIVAYSRAFKSARCSFAGIGDIAENHALIEPQQIRRA